MTGLLDRIALVTGASRGIGAAVAKQMAGAGAHVILLARTQGALEALYDDITDKGGKATIMPMDLRRLDNIDKLGPSINERFGALDILVGNAGMLGPLSPAHQASPKDWEKVFTVNFMANVRLVRTLDPFLRASSAGRVVFTGAPLAESPMAYWGPYAGSKAALENFAKTYAAETLKTNIKVNIIHPGIVDTALLKEAFPGGYKGQTRKPEDVAGAYLDLTGEECSKHGEIVFAS